MLLVCVRTVFRRHHQLARDVRPIELAAQEAQDLELPFAERLDQRLFGGRSSLDRDCSGQEPAHIARSVPLLRRQLQQRRHGRPFVDEDADVALRLSQRHRARQRGERTRQIAARVTGECLHDEDVDRAPAAPTVLRRCEQALRELDRLADPVVGTVPRPLRQEQPRQRGVLELVEVAELVRGRDTMLPRPAPRRRQASPGRSTPSPSRRRPGAHRGRSCPRTGARPRRGARARHRDRLLPVGSGPPRHATGRGTAAGRSPRPARGPSAGAATRPRGRCVRETARSCPRACPPPPAARARHVRSQAAVPARTCAVASRRRPWAIRMSAWTMAQPMTEETCPAFCRLAMLSTYERCAASRSPLVQATSPSSPAAAPRPS